MTDTPADTTTDTTTDAATDTLEVHEVLVERVLHGSPDRCFTAWIDPAQFAYWFGAELVVERVSLDVREGGAWRATMIAPDGSDMPFAGVYGAVVENQRIVMEFREGPGETEGPADVQTLTATFRGHDDHTHVELRHIGRMPEPNVAALEAGYGTFLDRIDELLAAGVLPSEG